MDEDNLHRLAEQLLRGETTPGEFAQQVKTVADSAGLARLSTATVDLNRRQRCGYPEVVYGEGKSVDSLKEILQSLVEREENVLATRIDAEKAARLAESFPTGRYNELARTFRIPAARIPATRVPATRIPSSGQQSEHLDRRVAIITAGTSDLPVAEEARETLAWMGIEATMIHDVGVAGPHRLPDRLDDFSNARAIVVVAGMEGALPSVVGGYVDCPVIAVPTSVGYGANLGGVTALLSMLNSCASNVAVVNIDAGFKGGYLAGLIAEGRRET